MLKEIKSSRNRQRHQPPNSVKKKPYVRFTPKMLYMNGPFMEEMGSPPYIKISVDGPNRLMVIANGTEEDFKLSSVCETKHSRRIETNRALMDILEAGFPKGMIGKYLTGIQKGMDGSMFISLYPDYNAEEVKESLGNQENQA